ncbi:MAG: hypothetical protein BWY79_02035 [Actinobacteria bacterium ADurb.Bin444]|nr:MAG: hypothetical protein BWY79_02035 [Actinobacteria bacterium ADurb.Bin444]
MVPLLGLPGLFHLPLADRTYTGGQSMVGLAVVEIEGQTHVAAFMLVDIDHQVPALLQRHIEKLRVPFMTDALGGEVPLGFEEELDGALAGVEVTLGRQGEDGGGLGIVAQVGSSGTRAGEVPQLSAAGTGHSRGRHQPGGGVVGVQGVLVEMREQQRSGGGRSNENGQ